MHLIGKAEHPHQRAFGQRREALDDVVDRPIEGFGLVEQRGGDIEHAHGEDLRVARRALGVDVDRQHPRDRGRRQSLDAKGFVTARDEQPAAALNEILDFPEQHLLAQAVADLPGREVGHDDQVEVEEVQRLGGVYAGAARQVFGRNALDLPVQLFHHRVDQRDRLLAAIEPEHARDGHRRDDPRLKIVGQHRLGHARLRNRFRVVIERQCHLHKGALGLLLEDQR